MGNRLSFSQLNMFMSCGKKYQYSYVHKLRERTRSIALVMGTAFDKATEAVLKDNSVDEKAIFLKHFLETDINGRKVQVRDDPFIVWAENDWDSDTLIPEDIQELVTEFGISPDNLDLTHASLLEAKKSNKATSEELRCLSTMYWLSVLRKGFLMLEENRKSILPQIQKVLATQKKIELKNPNGDSLIGYIDLHAVWKDGQEVILDYKTATRPYTPDSVKSSYQLAIYSKATKVKRAGYIVFLKQIRKNKFCTICNFNSDSRHRTCAQEINGKRCGGTWRKELQAQTQIIIDDIPDQFSKIVTENIESTNNSIKAGIYNRNFNECIKPYGPCPFISLCHKGTKEGLDQG